MNGNEGPAPAAARSGAEPTGAGGGAADAARSRTGDRPRRWLGASWAERGALLVILAVAAWLRLSELDLVRFNVDQVSLLENVTGIVAGTSWPTRGPFIGPSVFAWGRLGPAHYYLMAIPAAVLGPAIGVVDAVLGAWAFLGWLTVLGVYVLGERHVARGAGLVAAALAACCPYAIFVSREMVNSDLLPPTVVLLFLALAETLGGSRRAAVVACAILAFAMQLHIMLGMFLPVLVVALVAGRVGWRSAWTGLGLAVLLFTPFWIGQLVFGFEDLRGILGVLTGRTVGLDGPPAGLGTALSLAVGVLADRVHPPEIGDPAAGAALGRALLAGSAALGAALVVLGTVRGRRRVWHGVLLAWATLPILYLATYRGEPYHRYLLSWLPAGWLLAGLAVACVARVLGRALGRRTAIATGAVFLLGVLPPLLALDVRYRARIRDSGVISDELTLGSLRTAAAAIAARGCRPDPRRLQLSNLVLGWQPLAFLLREDEGLTPCAADDPTATLVLSPAPGSERLHSALAALGWDGALDVVHYAPALVPGSLTLERDERVIPIDGAELGHLGRPGPFRLGGRLLVRDGERVLVFVDTNGCLTRWRLGPIARELEPCAARPMRLWSERDVIAVPAELPPGEHRLVIDGEVPVDTLNVELFDLAIADDRLTGDAERRGLPSSGARSVEPATGPARIRSLR